MIFVTVGTDLPFDRMIRVVDFWARQNNRTDVFAQIGKRAWKPGFIESIDFLEPSEFKRRFNEASFVVSHAGMGTVLNARLYGKPLLIMPKLAALGEARNDHQLATARKLSEIKLARVAFGEDELRGMLDHIEKIAPSEPILPYANPELILALHDFVFSRPSP